MENLWTVNAGKKGLTKSVLVVDDEQNFVSLLDWFLTKNGYEVHTALNGKEALSLIDKNTFDLALLDIRMGPVDGIALLDELKLRTPGIKVIMMTAYPTADSRARAFLKGASVYFTKPVDLNDLLQMIKRITSTPSDDAIH